MMPKLLFYFLFLGCFCTLQAQSVWGKWKTVDDETGETKAVIKIYQEKGLLYGKVVAILNETKKNAICSNCKGKYKNKPVLGMKIIDGFSLADGVYKGKNLTDPSQGITVRGKVWLNKENPNKLMVRGYLAFFYRTQTWLRVVE